VTSTAPERFSPRPTRRRRTWLWVLSALIVIGVVGAITAYYTAPRPGGRMDPKSTSPLGGHALVALLRDQGVDVVVANTIADVEREARSDSLLLVAQTAYLGDDTVLQRLAAVPGDRLLVSPAFDTRKVLAPEIRTQKTATHGAEPNCQLPQATSAGTIQFETSPTYRVPDDTSAVSCYDGALVQYQSGGRTITLLGPSGVMVNDGLLRQGNAALALNVAGQRPRLIWYAPQHLEGAAAHGAKDIYDLIPDNVGWIVWQLCVVVALAALWQGRRMGPLVPEKLPVIVRASETVEGRGRFYRSRRARDRAADALRTAALQRMLPRLGVSVNADPPPVVSAVSERCDRPPQAVFHALFGPPPASDADLLRLAHELDDIERQVTRS
jgi:hypothetical protein